MKIEDVYQFTWWNIDDRNKRYIQIILNAGLFCVLSFIASKVYPFLSKIPFPPPPTSDIDPTGAPKKKKKGKKPAKAEYDTDSMTYKMGKKVSEFIKYMQK